MNTTTIGRACAAAVISLVGVAGASAPAHADDTAPSCDPAIVQAALTAAQADADAAKRAYVTHTRTAMKTLVAQYKGREAAEARSAARKAARLTAAAAKDPALRKAAQAARAAARAEAKESARVQRASSATLVRLVRAERSALKEAWDEAKEALHEQRVLAEDCAASASDDDAPEVEAPEQD